ncbi:unnamed protein product [Xylocopa violacea]|uniref:Odorant receptor n=1 Tax=Xylocopa violacea TaxID=135666 RepID=A0ABP1NKQ5_XYLVO
MYLNGILNMNKIKDALLTIKKDCDYYANRPEYMILQYHMVQGNKLIRFYSTYIYMSIALYLTLPTIPVVKHLIAPWNHSLPKGFVLPVNYGVDKQQYFYYIMTHTYVGMVVLVRLIVLGHTSFIMFTQHASALLAVISYQLRTMHILDTNGLIDVEDSDLLEKYKNINLPSGQEDKIYRKVLTCIRGHQRAIKYLNFVESLFTKTLLVQMFCLVPCLIILGVKTMLKIGKVGSFVRYVFLTFGQTLHIFCFCRPGQTLKDLGEEVYTAACDVTWYVLPKRSHNLYKFLLVRCLTPTEVTACRVISMSMETFIVILRTAMSYFTVLLSFT